MIHAHDHARFRRVALAAGLMLVTSLAWGQAFRCTVNGAIVYSDRPCAAATGVPPTTQAEVLPSTATPHRMTPGTPYNGTTMRAPDHTQHLSAECTRINEAIRTARSRGNAYSTVQALQDEYRRKCNEDDYNARMQQYQQQRQDFADKRAARDQDLRERRQAQRENERCLGMRDIIATKRARWAQLNEGERDALRHTEATYNTQCAGTGG